MLTRRSWIGLGLVVAAIVVLAAAWAAESRRHRSELEQADREIAAGRYARHAVASPACLPDGWGRMPLTIGSVCAKARWAMMRPRSRPGAGCRPDPRSPRRRP